MDKAYIVANEQQEQEVLEQLEREGYLWSGVEVRPTEQHLRIDEPLTIFAGDDKRLTFDCIVNEAYLADYEIEIDFDGRKEEQMSDKYVVSQEFMDKLEEWKNELNTIDGGLYISTEDFIDLPLNILKWRDGSKYTKEKNNRLIAIIRWINGEDVFEVEKPKKWVVRSKESDIDGDYRFVERDSSFQIEFMDITSNFHNATRFDTKEEAESWANAHQEIVEV